MPSQATPPHTRPRDRSAARATERRKRFWFNLASWATTAAIVGAVGLLVHWRVTRVLREDSREKEAEIELQRTIRSHRAAPADLERAAARLRALIAAYPDTESARKAEAELAKIEEARIRGERRSQQEEPPHPAAGGRQGHVLTRTPQIQSSPEPAP